MLITHPADRRMIAADAFLRTILDHPDDDGPRLVFADWLDEHGDPHGELIRVQCQLAHLPADDPAREPLAIREHELLAAHGADWLKPIRDLGLSARFRRGFLEVTITGIRTLLDSGEQLFARPWVLHIQQLRDAVADVEDIAELAASPHLARLQRLDLSRSRIGSEGVRKLAESPHRCRLQNLFLDHIQLSSSGLFALIEKMDLSRLTDLSLYCNGVGARGAKEIAQTPRLQALRVLQLSYNQIGNIGGEYLAESLYLGQLKQLHVRGNNIGTRAKKALRRRFGPRVFFGSNDSPF